MTQRQGDVKHEPHSGADAAGGMGHAPAGASAHGEQVLHNQPAGQPDERVLDDLAQAAGDADVGELGILHEQMAQLEQEATTLREQALRAQAEAQNARRRADEEVRKARKFALESFAQSLLPVLDSLEAGLAIEGATAEQIKEGADATLRQLLSALERNKVVAVAPVQGDAFDPNVHQAMSVVPAPDGVELPPNAVVTVLQKGYTIADRVLRPALVMVTAS